MIVLHYKINLTNFITEKLENLGDCFCDCSSLQFINLDSFYRNNILNMTNMFNGCSSLISIDFSKFSTKNLKKINDIFYNCYNLAYIDISSFNFNFKNYTLFNKLPNKGIIKINKNVYNETRNQIPSEWKIIFND